MWIRLTVNGVATLKGFTLVIHLTDGGRRSPSPETWTDPGRKTFTSPAVQKQTLVCLLVKGSLGSDKAPRTDTIMKDTASKGGGVILRLRSPSHRVIIFTRLFPALSVTAY